MADSARDKACGIISGGRVAALEAAGLRVVGTCGGCRHWDGVSWSNMRHRFCFKLELWKPEDFGCTEWTSR